MSSAIKYALLIIGFLVVLYILFWMIGMETLGILLVAVTMIFLSIGIALSYTTIQNIVSGLALMDSSPFDVGERIRVNDMMCDVIERGMVFTKVKNLEGEIVDIPNNEIIQSRIYNYSRAENHAIDVTFEVSFGISHEQVESYVKEAISGIEGILKDPKPEVRAKEFNGHHIVYEVVIFTKDVHKDAQLKSKIITSIQDIFQTEGHKTMVG
jgi:small-conductance mechanosensitive channel